MLNVSGFAVGGGTVPDTLDKKNLSERDICTKFITPAIQRAGWQDWQFKEEVSFTAGRIQVKGKLAVRGPIKRADYILYHKPNIPLALIEAKDNNHTVGHGMQQALAYAEALDIPFVYASNGDAFLEHDRTEGAAVIEREIALGAFPGPAELWQRLMTGTGTSSAAQTIMDQDYYIDPQGKEPRYYQTIAVNRTVAAIARGQNRILLVMATGTGKTYTAFQIIYRLWKTRAKKRILFLADRNILVDQAMTNDFKHFGDRMVKIKNRTVDKSYEIYLALYQGVTGEADWKNIYRSFSRDFFDLIVIDECHRGSAAEDSAWREILEYFSAATQIGLTATPKETKTISNMEYFGDPIYTYSLRQGIEDGFLAPYKVIRVLTDIDAMGFRPEKGQRDKYGHLIPDEEYSAGDFDRQIVIDERTLCVAAKIVEYLQGTDIMAKTIVFCQDIDHAERMRQAIVNLSPAQVQKNPKYVMRITGDSAEGKMELDNFIDPKAPYPVIATTSKLLTTGVDAQTCRLVVLDSNINSITEFKQIIGRGTRIREDCGKLYFTIMDFRGVTRLFADPAFDGDPVKIYEPQSGDPVVPPDENQPDTAGTDPTGIDYPMGGGQGGFIHETPGGDTPKKYYISGVEVSVIHQQVRYLDKNGDLITESLTDYTKKNVTQDYSTLADFLRKWNDADKKQAIIDALEEQGVLFEPLREEVAAKLGQDDIDPFDLVCHIVFDQKPLTRRERAERVRQSSYFARYGDAARAVLEALLDKYADTGIANIEKIDILKVRPFDAFGSPMDILKAFGGKSAYLAAIRDLEQALYTA